MARFIPKIDVEKIGNAGERVVARALKHQLPATTLVYHSYKWLRSGIFILEGETDFILFDPEHGLLVLEVKGGTITYDAEDHTYKRRKSENHFEEIKNPFTQARDNMHDLERRLLGHPTLREGIPFAYGYAVVFPDCTWKGPLPNDATSTVLYGAKDFPELGKKVLRTLADWRGRRPRPIGPAIRDAVIETLSPPFHIMPVLARTLEDQEEVLLRLTHEQEQLLTFLGSRSRAAIHGCAGSGKTLLAIAQAQRFARERGRTLFVCYNRALADEVAARVPDGYRDRIVVDTFHNLARSFILAAGLPFSPPQGEDAQAWWREKPAELLFEVAESLEPDKKFAAIVVDEGQDFEDTWWLALEQLATTPDPPMYVFFDERQAVFHQRFTLPASLGEPFVLSRNCRNTKAIAEMCRTLAGDAIEVHEDAPDGTAPAEKVVASPADVFVQTGAVLGKWCLEGKVPLSGVAILVPRKGEWPERVGGVRVITEIPDWRAGKGVLACTVRRFKGLEADAVVVAGVPEPGRHRWYTRADHYVACSRAKHLLAIVSLEEADATVAK